MKCHLLVAGGALDVAISGSFEVAAEGEASEFWVTDSSSLEAYIC